MAKNAIISVRPVVNNGVIAGLDVLSPVGQFTIGGADLSPSIVIRAAWHGIEQKLRDAAAKPRDKDTGRPATATEKWAAVCAVRDCLLAGEWSRRAEGGGAPRGGLLLAAILRLANGTKTEAEVRAFLDARTDEEQAALRRQRRIADMIEVIRAERAKAPEGTDAESILDGFLGDDDEGDDSEEGAESPM